MLNRSRRIALFVSNMALGLAAALAGAQVPGTQPAGESGRARDPLATKQQIVRDRMTQLEDRMFRLTEKLSKTEPEQAKKLEAALKQAQQLLVRRNMDEAIELLEAGKLTDASDRQVNVVKGLEGVLKILLEEGDNTKERQQEIDKLKLYQDQVQKLLDSQRKLKAQADSSGRLKQILAGIQAAIKELEGLIAKEEEQVAQASSAAQAGRADEAGQIGAEQQKIRQDTEALGKRLENPGAEPNGAQPDDPNSAEPGAPREGGTPGASPDQKTAKPDANQKGDQPAGKQPGDAPEQRDARPNQPPGHQGDPAPSTPGAEQQPNQEGAHPGQAAPQGGQQDQQKPAGEQGQRSDPQKAQPSADGQQPQGEDAVEKGVRQAQGDVQQAGEQMKAAESALEKKSLPDALPMQKKSVESLKRALQELKKQEQEARRQLDQAEAARKQRELERDAQQMAERMKSGQAPGDQQKGDQKGGQQGDPQQGGQQQGGPNQQPKGQQGNQQPGEQGQQQGRQNQQNQRPEEPVPGNQNVERAGQHMEKAADDLDKNKPEEASPQQQQAIEQLEQARKQLEEALDQLRREQQEEILRGLESRFRAMLAQQLIINEGTINLDKKGPAAWEHIDELKLASLTQDQSTVADQAGQSLHILKEEGTTVVFPRIVEQMREDMTTAASLLGDKKTDKHTQRIQEEIVNTLKELTEAIKELRKKIQEGEAGGNQPGQGGQNGQNPPLLPGSAELKLLRSCQERIHRDTENFDQEHTDRAALDGEARTRLRHIADRQQEVAEMARKMNERLTGQ